MEILRSILKWIRDPYKHKATKQYHRSVLDSLHLEFLEAKETTHPYNKYLITRGGEHDT